MIPIEEVYSPDDSYFYVSDYSPMLDSFGFETILQVDDNDYQGDSRVLYGDGDRIGYLNFGWGSCSGCDALQSCGSLQEVDTLRKDLFDSIRWFDTRSEALAWFNTHDWEGEYSWHHGEARQFVEQAKTLLDV